MLPKRKFPSLKEKLSKPSLKEKLSKLFKKKPEKVKKEVKEVLDSKVVKIKRNKNK